MRRKRVDGTSEEEVLVTSTGTGVPNDWASSGRYLLYSRNEAIGNSFDLWAFPLFGDRKSFPLVQTPFIETNGVFSPDGRWFAYQSGESGQTQVYVQPFPTTGSKFQISSSGGVNPIWRPDGKELFFLSPDSTMMVAAVDTAGEFQHGVSEALFQVPTLASSLASSPASAKHYAVTKDGRKFLVNAIEQRSRIMPLTVIVNWLGAVQR